MQTKDVMTANVLTVAPGGAALSEAELDAARVAAETTPGVRKVENNLFVLDARLRGTLGSQ